MTATVHAPTAGKPAAWPDRLLVLGPGTALVYGTLSHGGFYAGDGVTLLLLVAAAAVARLRLRRPVPWAVLVGVSALLGGAAWSVVSTLLAGRVAGALPVAAAVRDLAAAVWATSGTDAAGRRGLRAVVLACDLTAAAGGAAVC